MRRGRDEEVEGGSAGRGARPGEGCSQQLRVKSDPMKGVATAGEARGEPTVAAAWGGGGGWLLSTSRGILQ